MIARWRWLLSQTTKRLWFRATLFSLAGVLTALLAIALRDFVPPSLPAKVGADSVDKILSIIASSMLAVTTFSLSTMVSAYSAASNGVTPRATPLVMEDSTTQNALATFIGSFLFSLVGIIALSTGAYGAQGRVVLFAVTIVMVMLIVYTLLRWIDHLSKLGRVGETIDRVETAALAALERRGKWPFLGAAPYPADLKLPASAATLLSRDTGYVQHIDVSALGAVTEQHGLAIYLEVLPGSFLHEGAPLARVVWHNDGAGGAEAQVDVETKLLAAITIGLRRTFDQDPRFGLSVLAEIASRALSPATNDSGTVIDVIGRGVRCFAQWSKQAPEPLDEDDRCRQVHVRAIAVEDLFDDFFTLIARDGAGLLEIDIRFMKALQSLAQIDPALFGEQCRLHARLLLKRADLALQLEEDKQRLRAVAGDLPSA
ncbi:DUF2254 domain-containing protein [Pseudomonas cremoricolorata]|uniref:DUF2254 domain-containing protein n=1 Tax=Pseudomonas cremoricolorata TaxID=157783 RepID=A0A089WR28_9PSED|nr:DUF2254 domain-containing protein [Pseudomonas cremoricolorata]AIR91041.1 hypothetical protein LK03_18000 [Pseudomonas cremoricolorata]